ncbi:Aste57867_1183 [Aphanomyces stellatus]|uniref:Aste57867_1183 protein n=1 Tax=Aphanomyces stellatus TaxID=120398 RepID=A0A485K793_9STRA|nr:hypothetical protein As57867_001182 [Aphanomyces stellatus]VFT78403.1 Aste57867_1183 [Aphanomyces stellatus]
MRTVLVFAATVAAAAATTVLVAGPGDCITPELGLGRGGQYLANGQSEYLHGSYFQRGAIFRQCRDGTLVCFEEDGMADSVATETDCRKAVVKRRLGITIDPTVVKLWPESTLCYKLDDSFPDVTLAFIRDGFDHLRSSTNNAVSFFTLDECNAHPNKAKLCGMCKDYAYIQNKGESCSATVGYQAKGAQNVMVEASHCFEKGSTGYGTFVHEMMHALGIYHEQVHPHATSIVIATEVPAGTAKDYYPKADSVSLAFDAGSVMHYAKAMCLPKPEFALLTFCKLNQGERDGCVLATRAHCDKDASKVLGQRSAMSAVDKETVVAMYGPEKRIFALKKEQDKKPANNNATTTPTNNNATTTQPPTSNNTTNTITAAPTTTKSLDKSTTPAPAKSAASSPGLGATVVVGILVMAWL